MRNARILVLMLAAVAVSGCMRQTTQQSYYIIDPQTGQPVPVVSQPQQMAQAPYPAQNRGYPQPALQVPPPARALYSTSPAYAQQAYGQPQYAHPQYAQPRQPYGTPMTAQSYAQSAQPQPAPQAAQPSGGRGLFSSGRRTQTRYVQPQPMAQQPYVAQYTAPAPAPRAVYAAAPRPAYAAPYQAYASAPATGTPAYTLDSGDKLRVVVFGQDGITNSYTVDAGGNVNMPLIGSVPARGYTTQQLARTVTDKLKQGFVRDPSVTVEVEAYRPFFILGEVTTPGQYPYVANMTVEAAVAIAGGFGPRASKSRVQLTRNAPGQQINGEVPLNYPLRPGDTIVVKERWF